MPRAVVSVARVAQTPSVVPVSLVVVTVPVALSLVVGSSVRLVLVVAVSPETR